MTPVQNKVSRLREQLSRNARRGSGFQHPLTWIPTLYFAEGAPYAIVVTLSVVMYGRLGMSNADIALYTSWLYLPWVIKPFWSPFIELIKTRRWWIVSMQLLIGVALAGMGFALGLSYYVVGTLVCLCLIAFSSATHDIAADGFYMLALHEHDQSLYVGWRSTFYRIAIIVVEGLLIALVGYLALHTRSQRLAWSGMFYAVSAGMFLLLIYHYFLLPQPVADKQKKAVSVRQLCYDFWQTFVSFFRKPYTVSAILFMLFYRFSEALLIKIAPLFLMAARKEGGLALSDVELGFVKTVGVIGLLLGGILGGHLVARDGMRRWLYPMVGGITLPHLVYVYLSFAQPEHLGLISGCVFVEQFGYGFGFTAYMIFLMHHARGEQQTAHYAICTAFMAMSMMLPGMFSGWLEEHTGYVGFFLLVMACCLTTVWVARLIHIDRHFGKR